MTVEVNGQSRTFKHGDHVTFPANSGGKQTLTFNGVEFVGYGIVALAEPQTNNLPLQRLRRPRRERQARRLAARDAVAPRARAESRAARRRARRAGGVGGNRHELRAADAGAGAALSLADGPPVAAPTPVPSRSARQGAGRADRRPQQAVAEAQNAVSQALRRRTRRRSRRRTGWPRRGQAPRSRPTSRPCRTSTRSLPPTITGDDEFYGFLFSGRAGEVRRASREGRERRAAAPDLRSHAKITVNIDNTYEVISTQLSKNVVGMVEGSDPKLKDTYVIFGAHLDHVGLPDVRGRRPRRRTAARSRDGAGGEPDLIFNGADDDGSGSTALLGIAKAFATGPKPKRSVDLRLARRRKSRAARFALHGRLPGRAARQGSGPVQHRHDRPESGRRPESGQHRVRDRRRSHQHRPS